MNKIIRIVLPIVLIMFIISAKCARDEATTTQSTLSNSRRILQSPCPQNFYFNSTTNSCTCRSPFILNADNSCLCKVGFNVNSTGDGCSCDAPFVYNANADTCTCASPFVYSVSNNVYSCKCNTPFTYNEVSGTCFCIEPKKYNAT